MEKETYAKIDLLEIAQVLLHRALLLLACLAAGAIVTFCATKLLITPQYSSTSMVYIYTKTTSITSLADLQIGSQLAVDFETLAVSRPVVEAVIARLSLDTTYEELLRTVTITNPSNTRILKVYATNPDPQLAADISNAMAQSISDRIAEVMSTDKPFIAETAIAAKRPSSPHLLRCTLLGAFLCFFIAAAGVLLRYYLDDTIQTASDVAHYLDVDVLAALPLEHTPEQAQRPRRHSTKPAIHSHTLRHAVRRSTVGRPTAQAGRDATFPADKREGSPF